MQFQTPVNLPTSPQRLTPDSHAVLLGSCFAQHIGERMVQSLPDGHVVLNPCGTLYNPHSLLHTAQWLTTEGQGPTADLCFEGRDGLWHHRLFSTDVSAPSRNECWEQVEERIAAARTVAQRMTHLFVTLSTDHVYRLRADESVIVANCHKEPAAHFREEIYPLQQMIEEWSAWVEWWQGAHPQCQLIFTLSPYRYAKYGMHASQLSKARLLLLIDSLQERFGERVSYFPAYEILMDELRDYRFYEADMLHPSHVAVDYIWERFTEWAFSPTLTEYATERERLRRDFAHHILHPESPEAQAFLLQREARRQAFLEKFGGRFAT